MGRYQSLWLIALPAIILLCGAVVRIWVAEDGFITFRSVENLWQGHGPVYNSGIRVESFSHPLWFLLLCALRVFGAELLAPIAAVIGIICSVIGILLAADAAKARCETALRLFPLGALAIATLPPFWDFASSGLETGLTFLWLGWCSSALTRACRSSRVSFSCALLIGLGPLIRPDLGIISICLMVALVMNSKGTACARFAVLCGAILPGALWQVFRMGYYAAIVPTTFIAKESFNSVWWRGYLYLEDFLRTYNPEWILFLGACALASRSPRWAGKGIVARETPEKRQNDRIIAALVIAGALHILSVCRVGGDFMHARMLLPGIFAVLSSFAVIALPRWKVARVAMIATCVLWCGWSTIYARTSYSLTISPVGIANERLWHAMRTTSKRALTLKDYDSHFFGEVARDVRQRTLSEGYRAVFIPNIGVPAYQLGTNVVVIDSLGLNDYVGSRLRLTGYGRAGHEKVVPAAWFLARYPAPEGYISPVQSGRISSRLPSPEELSAAQWVLASPPLIELRDAVTAPMTVDRFVRNITLSWRLTFLRFPSDPLAARQTLAANNAKYPGRSGT